MKSGIEFEVLNCDKRRLDTGAHYFVDVEEGMIIFDDEKDEHLKEFPESAGYIFDSKDITLSIKPLCDGNWWCSVWY